MPKGRKPTTGSGAQNGGGRRPVDSETRKRIVDLARGGMTRNAIARECSVSPSTVSRIVTQDAPDVSFDREATRVAVQSAVIDARQRRADIAVDLLGDMGELRRHLFGVKMKRTHYSVTNGQVDYESEATPGEMKDLAIAFGIMADKHMALVRFDSDDRDMPLIDRWLSQLGVPALPTVVAA